MFISYQEIDKSFRFFRGSSGSHNHVACYPKPTLLCMLTQNYLQIPPPLPPKCNSPSFIKTSSQRSPLNKNFGPYTQLHSSAAYSGFSRPSILSHSVTKALPFLQLTFTWRTSGDCLKIFTAVNFASSCSVSIIKPPVVIFFRHHQDQRYLKS